MVRALCRQPLALFHFSATEEPDPEMRLAPEAPIDLQVVWDPGGLGGLQVDWDPGGLGGFAGGLRSRWSGWICRWPGIQVDWVDLQVVWDPGGLDGFAGGLGSTLHTRVILAHAHQTVWKIRLN
ncbi:unnamed protein product [Natator depressus]